MTENIANYLEILSRTVEERMQADMPTVTVNCDVIYELLNSYYEDNAIKANLEQAHVTIQTLEKKLAEAEKKLEAKAKGQVKS